MSGVRKIIRMLESIGISYDGQRRLARPITEYCGSLGGVPGVTSLEIGFWPITSSYRRDFGEFPDRGVFHLVTVIDKKDWRTATDRKLVYSLVGQEDSVLHGHPNVPIEFHIGSRDKFPGKSASEIFDALVPKNTRHLMTVPKGQLQELAAEDE